MVEKEWHDKELGIIKLRRNSRIKRYSLKVTNGIITGTIPLGGSEETMIELISEYRLKLIIALQKYPAREDILSDKTELKTNTFSLHIFRSDRNNYYMTLKEGVLHIACPQDTDFNNDKIQQLFKGFLEKALRHEAKRILPERLNVLARKYNFSYSGIRIKNSKKRWGSCTSKGNINLSLSLMLLPDKLINYVLLHELCHTKEMNHSKNFWKLMNDVTDNKVLELRKELKSYRIM